MEEIAAALRSAGLRLQWILETHVHADHMSAAPYIKERLGGRVGIGSHITTVQSVFGKLFNAGSDFARDGSLPWPEYDRAHRNVHLLSADKTIEEPAMPAAKFLP